MAIDTATANGSKIRTVLSKLQKSALRRPAVSLELASGITVFFAVALNFVLASVNANFMELGRTHIIMAEVLVVLSAILICYRSSNRLMMPWLVVVWLMTVLFIILCLLRQSIEPKYFRDVLMVPVFVTLGLAFAKGNIIRLFIALQALILGAMLIEGVMPELFGELVNPLQYYVNTRDFKVEAFWNSESTLFLSAWRPQERFFDFIDIHRLSSIFLEPVSLGNWCIVVTIFVITLWRDLSRGAALFLIITNLVILVGSDGRFATVTALIVLAVSLIALKLPRYSHFFYLPGALLVAVGMVLYFQPGTGDNFLGRLGFSVEVLASMDLAAILGLNLELAGRSADSGVSYIIMTQSLIGLAIFWGAVCFLQARNTRMGILCVHCICVYVSLSLLISYSMFSIKTAAPLWFLYGYVCARSYNLQRNRNSQAAPKPVMAGDGIAPQPR